MLAAESEGTHRLRTIFPFKVWISVISRSSSRSSAMKDPCSLTIPTPSPSWQSEKCQSLLLKGNGHSSNLNNFYSPRQKYRINLDLIVRSNKTNPHKGGARDYGTSLHCKVIADSFLLLETEGLSTGRGSPFNEGMPCACHI